MDTEKSMREKLAQAFSEKFGSTQGAEVFFSPSRINIIGEHIDYNGGPVFPCALTIGTYALARPNGRDLFRLYSLNLDNYQEVALPLPPYQEERDWANYAVGVYHYMEKLGKVVPGLDVVVYGNIPNGSGLSSSASLELLFGVLGQAYGRGRDLTTLELVEAGVWCENAFFGLQTGIMDQYVIAFGQKDHAMLLDTAKKTHRQIPLALEEKGAVFMVLNTRKRRELKDSKYNERRRECESALAELNAILTKKGEAARPDLCSFSLGELDLLEKLSSPILKKRARHVITEKARVLSCLEAFQKNQLDQVGFYLREGHRSLKEDYAVTGKELDAIVEAANAHPACYGARMTGAGFGGCAVALVKKEGISDFSDYVRKAYKEKVGLDGELILSDAGDGARKL